MECKENVTMERDENFGIAVWCCVIAIIMWYNATMNLQHFDTSLTLSCFLFRILFDSSPLNLSHHQNNEFERPSSEVTMQK